MLVSLKDVVVGEVRAPDRVGFLIAGDAVLLRALEVGSIQTRGVQLVDLRQELPGEVDGSLFEVVSERPVAEHLEEGVVIPRMRKRSKPLYTSLPTSSRSLCFPPARMHF